MTRWEVINEIRYLRFKQIKILIRRKK